MSEVRRSSSASGVRVTPSGRFSRNLVCTLATGYILFVFSERLFWTVWRPDDHLTDLIITWLAYSVAAYLFLAAVSWFRANDFWSIFLAGALYGWLVEGGLIYTLYGTESSAPFPISLSITGLSWHALISVMLGWWATGWALTADRPRNLLLISLAIGIFWGVWAMFPRRESPPIVTTTPAFLLNAALLSLGLVASWWLSFRAGVREFKPGKIGFVLCTLTIGLFYSQHVIRLGAFPLAVFPGVLSIALVPLAIHRRYVGSPSHGDLFLGTYHPGWLPVIGLIPCIATIVYWIAASFHLDRLPITSIVYYAVTGPLGLLLLILSVVVCIGRARRKAIVSA